MAIMNRRIYKCLYSLVEDRPRKKKKPYWRVRLLLGLGQGWEDRFAFLLGIVAVCFGVSNLGTPEFQNKLR